MPEAKKQSTRIRDSLFLLLITEVAREAEPSQRNSIFEQKAFNLVIEVEPGTDLSTTEITLFQWGVRGKTQEGKAKVAVFANQLTEIPTEIGISLVNIR